MLLLPIRYIQTSTSALQKHSTSYVDTSEAPSSVQDNILRQNHSFAQDGPKHDENMYLADPFMRRCLQRLIPKDTYARDVHPDLSKFGHRVTAEIWDLGRKCEDEPPYLAGHTDAWGKP